MIKIPEGLVLDRKDIHRWLAWKASGFTILYEFKGICAASKTCFVHKIAKTWDKFSGDFMFPVPSPDSRYTAAYYYHGAITLWDKNTEYGRLRWELVYYIDSIVHAYIQESPTTSL